MHRSFAKHDVVDDDGLRMGTVLIVAPGGLENGGGIGRQMGYFLRAYQAKEQRLHYRVIDLRGPRYLGSSPRYIVGAVIYFGKRHTYIASGVYFVVLCGTCQHHRPRQHYSKGYPSGHRASVWIALRSACP